MANVKLGFEGQIKMGNAGSTATSLLENVKDISYGMDVSRGDSTVRGDSSVAPMKTEEVSQRIATIDFTMIHDTTDTLYEDLMEAVSLGSGVAIRTLSYSSGKGFDGDCTLSAQDGRPLDGEATTQFTATPSRAYGRAPNPYV